MTVVVGAQDASITTLVSPCRGRLCLRIVNRAARVCTARLNRMLNL
jgi:hypothetical protein